MSKPIYFVVTVRLNAEARAVGSFYSKDDAVQVIKENMGDINEDRYYQYAMIEEVHQGLYPVHHDIGSNEQWFSWRAAHVVPVHDAT